MLCGHHIAHIVLCHIVFYIIHIHYIANSAILRWLTRNTCITVQFYGPQQLWCSQSLLYWSARKPSCLRHCITFHLELHDDFPGKCVVWLTLSRRTRQKSHTYNQPNECLVCLVATLWDSWVAVCYTTASDPKSTLKVCLLSHQTSLLVVKMYFYAYSFNIKCLRYFSAVAVDNIADLFQLWNIPRLRRRAWPAGHARRHWMKTWQHRSQSWRKRHAPSVSLTSKVLWIWLLDIIQPGPSFQETDRGSCVQQDCVTCWWYKHHTLFSFLVVL